MGVISGKKPKLGTLDKSKMDWNSFVQEEGIKEELQTHNKGKEGQVAKIVPTRVLFFALPLFRP